MSDDPGKKDDPAAELKQGLSHLWKAARGVATGVKREVERTDFGKELSGAGREFVRAAANVVDRIADEVGDLAKGRHHDEGSASGKPPGQTGSEEEDEFDGVKPRQRDGSADGSTPPDPGVRISVDDETKKKGP